jgi:hypothetical protein
LDKLEADAKKEMYRVEFYPNAQRPNTAMHVGQLKLFLSTLQFLIDYVTTKGTTHVIYPGSAPGYNIKYLTELFPSVEWHLFDPREFDKSLHKNIHVKTIVVDEFLPVHIQYLKDIIPSDDRILLISDIRVCDDMSEKNIDRDMRLQEEWVRDMQPHYSQLKFRLPRSVEFDAHTQIDHDDIIDDTYIYLDGKIHMQMFSLNSSTESRLVVSRADIRKSDVEYNVNMYEAYMNFFQRRVRVASYPAINGQHTQHDKGLGLDSCHDCSMFRQLVSNYNSKHNGTLTTSKVVANIINIKFKMIAHKRDIVQRL